MGAGAQNAVADGAVGAACAAGADGAEDADGAEGADGADGARGADGGAGACRADEAAVLREMPAPLDEDGEMCDANDIELAISTAPAFTTEDATLGMTGTNKDSDSVSGAEIGWLCCGVAEAPETTTSFNE